MTMAQRQLINLTPHAVRILGDDNEIIAEIPPSGQVIRLEEEAIAVWEVNGIQVVDKRLKTEGTKLPPESKGTMYIVPLAVAQSIKRRDLLVPDSLVRDSEGKVIGCRRFARIVE